MVKTIGKIMEVVIPSEYQNQSLVDVMDRTKILFKILTDKGLKDFVLEANEVNAKIMKNDMVLITEQDISGKHFVDIEIYEGDDSE